MSNDSGSKPSELWGTDARRYANENLRKVRVDADAWQTEFVDQDGEVWLLEYPHSELQGGGEPRLRRLGKPVES